MMDNIKQHWAIRRSSHGIARLFSGAHSSRDARRLQAWYDNSPAYRNRFSKTLQLLADMEPLGTDPDILALVESHPIKQAPGKHAVANRWQWPAALAAAVVVATLIGVGLLREPAKPAGNPLLYVTRVGEQKTLQLADGSDVVLNTDSRLLVDFSREKRRLSLDHGEAYFNVAQDPSRPFTVEVGERAVSALGTAFNLFKSPERFTLAVIEGVVSLHQQEEQASASAPLLSPPGDQAIQLKSNGQLRVQAGMVAEFDISRQQLTAYKALDIDKFSSWRHGVLRFDAEPFYKVVMALNRYSGKKILIEDTAVMELEVYAAIKLDNMNTALATLESALPIKVIQYSDRIVIVGQQP